MSRHSMRVVGSIEGVLPALVTVLRFPVIMGLLALDCTCGILAPIYVGFRFELLLVLHPFCSFSLG